MISGNEGYKEWFPGTFEITPGRLGLGMDGGPGDWEEVGADPEWELVEKDFDEPV